MYHTYQSSLSTRYASKTMQTIHSAQTKYATWRVIWTELAKCQKQLGLSITQEQIDELEKHIHTIDFAKAAQYEKQLKHDVMAHIHTYGDQCPKARPIIHLGATSCLITDNAEVLIMQKSLLHIHEQLITFIRALAEKADQYKELACLSYTHFQPAQPTTVGKRIAMWLYEFMRDIKKLTHCLDELKLLGLKGATGTQAAFLQLFAGDHEKVKQLEQLFVSRLPCKKVVPISGQTYTRKQDMDVLHVLASIAVSAHKMATDLRLLAHLQEIEETRTEGQVGSSAMPYKHNPMRAERICSLARYIMSLTQNPMYTAATQWFERSLDDSANRRLIIPDAFLATDAVLQLLIHVVENMEVHPFMVHKHLQEVLPFMATEAILMACVQKGADRQTVHEIIRMHSSAVAKELKTSETKNNLLEKLAHDENILLDENELANLMNPKQFTGRAQQQVEEFLEQEVEPLLQKYIHVQSTQSQVMI